MSGSRVKSQEHEFRPVLTQNKRANDWTSWKHIFQTENETHSSDWTSLSGFRRGDVKTRQQKPDSISPQKLF
ncbi:hypothetical protein L596_009932 [Steinernema carpocapsae]|uniref:Uncharacterized protein n=1 Tax=Steinernema carpocapsae TaxID=34508 RepID=A0A4U5PGS8_STECR|nr:hypothetical protein L596_009932 [Steinernema carpocapsae]